jgi:type II secretory pathway pseudopilin PulG
MNLKRGAYHNIYGMSLAKVTGQNLHGRGGEQSSEAGYSLVAMLALMTLLAMIALSAAPSLHQQALREREKESIFRGEQVADAIRDYYLARANKGGGVGEQSLPTSIDQLLEGVPIPGGSKKRQVLRLSATRDPLSSTGEWRTVRPRAPELVEFHRALLVYANNVLPRPNDQMAQLQQFAVPPIGNVVNIGSGGSAPEGEHSGTDSSGPFVGVTSRSRRNSILYYYGIDRHDQWIFTPLFK